LENKPKVTRIGGIYFKTKAPNATKEWYRKNLGLATDQYRSSFEFRNANRPEEINYLQWSPFTNDADYFYPSTKEFMVNYRVQHIERLVENLKEAGVTICDEIESFDCRKFVHIMDLDGNKIELWEPVDHVFTDMLKDNTTK
jgi:predicted enzyme related to lactoylglutathione lyase